MNESPRFWFPAKRYGWGWGIPSTWQGWVVLTGFIVAATAIGVLIAPHSLVWFYLAMAGLSGVFIAICYAKGEPPRWRWGN